MKKIGVLTSGGDGSGMNAAIRSVVRYASHNGLEVAGIMRGYQGLIDDDIISLSHRSVSNVINKGGTLLKTARCKEFFTREGRKKAAATVKRHGIDALVVIGGNGSYHGAHLLFSEWKVPCACIPGTIDNDIRGTDATIGSDTAVNTALDAIDKIRDTCTSMERIFVIEVMGRDCGFIAIESALGGGAEDVLVPELKFDLRKICERIKKGRLKGKISWIIIVAEGAAKAQAIAAKITKITRLETRVVVLGHIQRGGIPTAKDRILATRLGSAAVDLLLNNQYDKAAGIVNGEINVIPVREAIKKKDLKVDNFYRLINILT
ncbi:MAG: 6-phosphofructokinase [Candidatus Omnitrophica bacterium CG11_big_fil_rev_8_21_14_0_20_42_13]|uniref:ATP-dependent 6-phosphofructokinase n=1 Tax=Candidatus Ghiorseimicrobium undicola TaxID=1974746 RepID=A0A2H0LX19_9BACT|nr:MAG: 6-phosphofructokinase [Candidatus Omnitrophica bacterium CG11_big_fil_rev_8_21_14_0_20_42_13]